MIEIGKKLQKRREELNLTYEDVSAITKLSLAHIKAIEAGNLDYFKDDLTYIRFYVRSYCKALDIPYENFKDDIVDSVEEYTNTITLKRREEIEQIEKTIAQRNMNNPVKTSSIVRKEVETLIKEKKGPKLQKKDRASLQQNAQKNVRFKNKSNVDFSMVSLLAVLGIIVCVVLYVGLGSLFDNEEPNNPGGNEPPVVDPGPAPEPEVDEPPVVVEEMEIRSESATTYIVENVKKGDEVKVEITFGSYTWFDGTFNQMAIRNDKPDKLYLAPETYTIANPAGENDRYEFIFGYFAGTQMKINGKDVMWDPSIASTPGSVTIVIQVKGE